MINGRKWWISGAADERCKIFIVMGKTDPSAPPAPAAVDGARAPSTRPASTIVRALPVFGYQDQEGHCEIQFTDVRVPVTNVLGEEGGGFAIAQARLGPGRIHHCMRTIGAAERALELMCRRVTDRVAFGKPLAEQGVIQEWIADSRMEIEQARLLTLKAAWLMDTVGAKGARIEISAIKVVVPNMALRVIDRAIQAHGGMGVSDDVPAGARCTPASARSASPTAPTRSTGCRWPAASCASTRTKARSRWTRAGSDSGASGLGERLFVSCGVAPADGEEDDGSEEGRGDGGHEDAELRRIEVRRRVLERQRGHEQAHREADAGERRQTDQLGEANPRRQATEADLQQRPTRRG